MIAVIYYAYGGPKTIDDVEAYFSHIPKGKDVPAPMLEKIVTMFKKPGFPAFIRRYRLPAVCKPTQKRG